MMATAFYCLCGVLEGVYLFASVPSFLKKTQLVPFVTIFWVLSVFLRFLKDWPTILRFFANSGTSQKNWLGLPIACEFLNDLKLLGESYSSDNDT